MIEIDFAKKCIVSNNCWGSGFYQERKLEYNTPFVGLYMYADDYIALLNDFRSCMAKPLEVSFESRFGRMEFPIGKIGSSIEIFFLHYGSCEEAYEKWMRRASRIPKNDNDLLIKICDRDGFESRHISEFQRVNLPNKIGFLKKGRFTEFDPRIFVEINCEGESCPSGTELFDLTNREPISQVVWNNLAF